MKSLRSVNHLAAVALMPGLICAFNDHCLVIVRAKAGSSGKIKLVAKADGIAMETVSITAR